MRPARWWCSSPDGRPASVSTTGEDRWNIVVWLDHRAIAEAEECSATGHRVLDFVGGTMSPEMEMPKLMWLKRHLPAEWQRYGRLMDLADLLTFRACGANARSVCTLACKWTYLAHESPGWQADFLRRGRASRTCCGARRCRRPRAPSRRRLGGLLPAAAAELGLTADCRVGCGLIDAHAGALGVLGGLLGQGAERLDRHLALIAGTSTCHMALSLEPRAVPGVWGPYLRRRAAGLLAERGRPVGDRRLARPHPRLARRGPARSARRPCPHPAARSRSCAPRTAPTFAAGLHVLPDFHGNRSPLADPHAVGVISGLTLDASFDSLCRLYYRTAVGIALGTRHILDALNAKGYAHSTRCT